MVSGHMDEVGFMVTKITKNGMLKFQTLGGWSPNVLQAQKWLFIVKRADFGLVASTPPHLGGKEKPNIKDMLIDIGADSEEHAKEQEYYQVVL